MNILISVKQTFDLEGNWAQERFEKLINDKFEAMELDKEGDSKYIWT